MEEQIYTAKPQSVDKALTLLRPRQSSKADGNHKIINRTAFYCSSSKLHCSRSRKRKKVTSSGFSPSLIIIEMRKCLLRHDWSGIAQLLPLLLDQRVEIEPLVWRYVVTELLYSSKCTVEKLNHFLDMCVKIPGLAFLKKILTIPSHTTESNSRDPICDLESECDSI